MEKPDLQQEDPELYAILKKEETKQQEKITIGLSVFSKIAIPSRS